MLKFIRKLFAPAPLAAQGFGITDRGMVRENNEDNFGIMDGAKIFMVADGMGGHNGGEVASRTAVDTLVSHFNPETVSRIRGNPAAIRHALVKGFEAANETVTRMAEADPELNGMGCTMVCAMIDGRTLHSCHVGDARCYLLPPGGELKQITTDHTTMVQFQAALESEETLPELPQRNVVTRVIGYPFPEPPEYHAVPLVPGSRVLLCSDGLWSMLDEKEMTAFINGASSPKEACEKLVAEGNRAGGTDNITALVIFC